jgi:ATP-dependent RNA helicase DOB1
MYYHIGTSGRGMVENTAKRAATKQLNYCDSAPDPLNSSYRIRYNMLLNMMHVEDFDPEY